MILKIIYICISRNTYAGVLLQFVVSRVCVCVRICSVSCVHMSSQVGENVCFITVIEIVFTGARKLSHRRISILSIMCYCMSRIVLVRFYGISFWCDFMILCHRWFHLFFTFTLSETMTKLCTIMLSVRCIYRKISSIRRTKSENLSDCCIVLQLPLANPLKPDVKLRMKM